MFCQNCETEVTKEFDHEILLGAGGTCLKAFAIMSTAYTFDWFPDVSKWPKKPRWSHCDSSNAFGEGGSCCKVRSDFPSCSVANGLFFYVLQLWSLHCQLGSNQQLFSFECDKWNRWILFIPFWSFFCMDCIIFRRRSKTIAPLREKVRPVRYPMVFQLYSWGYFPGHWWCLESNSCSNSHPPGWWFDDIVEGDLLNGFIKFCNVRKTGNEEKSRENRCVLVFYCVKWRWTNLWLRPCTVQAANLKSMGHPPGRIWWSMVMRASYSPPIGPAPQPDCKTQCKAHWTH